MVLCRMVDLSILRGWPCPCSMVHSSLMSTLNWSRRFFSDLLRDALDAEEEDRRNVRIKETDEQYTVQRKMVEGRRRKCIKVKLTERRALYFGVPGVIFDFAHSALHTLGT